MGFENLLLFFNIGEIASIKLFAI